MNSSFFTKIILLSLLSSLTLIVHGHPLTSIPLALGLGDPDYTDGIQIREGLDVTWEVYNANQTVIFDLTCECLGWIGFGINNNLQVVPMDLMMGGVDGDKGAYFKDRQAVEVGYPIIDESQDWHLIDASEADGVTKLRFYRLFDTGDEHDLPITAEESLFVWAVGVDDFINEESLFDTPYHGITNRGTVAVHILRGDNATIV